MWRSSRPIRSSGRCSTHAFGQVREPPRRDPLCDAIGPNEPVVAAPSLQDPDPVGGRDEAVLIALCQTLALEILGRWPLRPTGTLARCIACGTDNGTRTHAGP